MNRNQNSHFAENPKAEIARSRFDRGSSVKFSFNAGDLIPFYVDEVLPGDTFSIDTSKLVRMQSLITPVMDNIYLDTYYFFVPNRLVMDKWKNLMGENTEAPWYPETTVQVPQVQAPEGGWKVGSIADYMGIPVGCHNFSVSALPFRAYALIWNEWFRDENLQTPQHINNSSLETLVGDNIGYDDDIMGFPFNPDPYRAIKGGFPLKACKFKDYFTSCLPSPQKGPDVLLPLGQAAPVFSGAILGSYNRGLVPKELYTNIGSSTALLSSMGLRFYTQVPGSTELTEGTGSAGNLVLNASGGSALEHDSSTTGGNASIFPANLWADLTNATAASVNQLRLAFAMQRIYEKDARGGTRYIEILANHFGVTSPDSRLQRPEYLGGNRMLINVNQVIQTSETANTPQGNTAAYSLTVDNHSDFTHSFVEHGFLIGLCVARYQHSYEEGLERFWRRKDRFDYYFPSLANIGEQPVYDGEIHLVSALNNEGYDNERAFSSVFGYQEAWADYRYKPNRVAGEMRAGTGSLDDEGLQRVGSLYPWTLTDYYGDTPPSLSSAWIAEDSKNLNRCLAVSSMVSNQLFADIYVHNVCTRPMPLFSR